MGVVNAALDDGGGHEHVDLAGHELLHDVFDLVGGHLAMSHTHASLGRHAQHALHGLVDGLHAVRHVVDLPATGEFQAHGRAHDVLVPLSHMHLHGDTADGRRLDERHVAHAAHGHLHRARNRRCRKGQHVNLLTQVLEVLLVLHAKALLLIDDDKPQVAWVNVARKESMGTHKHLHRACGEPLEGLLLLLGGAETAEHLHFHVEIGKTLEERLVVLLSQNRRGTQHHDLLAVLRGLEGSTQRDLGLAKAHVSAQQAVHRLGGLHVGFDVLDGSRLIGRYLVGEAFLHLTLPGRVRRKGKATRGGAARVQVDEVKGQRLGRFARLGGRAGPVSRVETREARGIGVGTHVARQAVDLLERHKQLVGTGIFKLEVITLFACNLLAHDGRKVRDAVRGMHHVVARFEGERDVGHIDVLAASVLGHAALQVGRADDGQTRVGDDDSRRYGGVRHRDGTARERLMGNARPLGNA